MAALERELKKVGITAVADGDDFMFTGEALKEEPPCIAMVTIGLGWHLLHLA
jgi:hypothetical protein